jgi:hypothetical protein
MSGYRQLAAYYEACLAEHGDTPSASDDLVAWLVASVSPNFDIRADYGLPEYTTYVYR